jgi:hypothetical protein
LLQNVRRLLRYREHGRLQLVFHDGVLYQDHARLDCFSVGGLVLEAELQGQGILVTYPS